MVSRETQQIGGHHGSHSRVYTWSGTVCIAVDTFNQGGRAVRASGVPGKQPTVILSMAYWSATFCWCVMGALLWWVVSLFWQLCNCQRMKESSALILLLAGLTSQVSIIQRSTGNVRSEIRRNGIKPTLDMLGYEIIVPSAHINLKSTLFKSGFQSLQDLTFVEDAL